MPDSDPLDSLDDFSEGLHVNALPASEVRRRGDRMRRRNTALATVGGVIAAAVFIGTPVALMSGNDDDVVQPAPPAPTQTDDSSDGGWLTEIPAPFPLADGYPEGSESTDDPTLQQIVFCGQAWPATGAVDAKGVFYEGESEDSSSRILMLLEDDTAAEQAMRALREQVQACPNAPTDGGDSIYESSLVALDLGTEQSVVVAQQIREDDGSLSQLTVLEAARSGNAINYETSYGAAGGQDVVDVETVRLKDRASLVLGAMCVFSADPCSTTEITPDPGNSEAPPVEESVAAIPADFPLDAGIEPSGEGDLTGPDAEVEASPAIDLCGTPAWKPTGMVERLAVRSTGIEYLETRELLTFITTDVAIDAVQQVRDAVAACPTTTGRDYAGYVTKVLDGSSDYDSFAWGAFDDTGAPWGWTFQLTRVGNAVLVLYSAGEMSESSLQPATDAQTEDTMVLAPEMCVFTKDGCGG